MSRNRVPFDFPEREPAVTNTGEALLSQVTPGSTLFDELTGSLPGALPRVNERTALTISAIYACVNLIAGAIAALPLNLYSRKDDGERDLLPSDRLWWILNEEMTPRWSAHAGWEFLLLCLLLLGDAFARIKRNGFGEIVGLEPIHPGRVMVLLSQDGMRLVYVVQPDPYLPAGANAGPLVLDQDDMVHVPGFGFNGLRGLSPLSNHLRTVGAVASAAQDYSARFFVNNARPDYALHTDQRMAPEAVDKLREQVDEKHRGLLNQHRPIVLTNGLKVASLGLNAEEMQLIATRQFEVEEICRIYGVPPFMVGHNEKTTSWGSGVEAMGIGFVRYCLRQHTAKIEAEINRKFFRRPSKVAEYDPSELERADTQTLYAALGNVVGGPGKPGIMTVDEARARLRLKKKGGKADNLYIGAPNAPAEAAQPAGS